MAYSARCPPGHAGAGDRLRRRRADGAHPPRRARWSRWRTCAHAPGHRQARRWRCPTSTGATASRSAAWRRSTRERRRRLARRRRLRHQLRRPPAALRSHAATTSAPRLEPLVDALCGAIPSGVGPSGRVRAVGRRGAAGGSWPRARAWAVGAGLRRGATTSSAIEDDGTLAGRGSRRGLGPRATSAGASSSARSARATTSSRCRSSTRSSTPEAARRPRPRAGPGHGDDPLRLARPRPPGLRRTRCRRCRARCAGTGSTLPDRQLACAPIDSPEAQALPRRDGGRRQLRLRQPPGDRPTAAREAFERVLGVGRGSARHAAGLRRRPQHREVRGARGRRAAAPGAASTARARRAPSRRAIPSCRSRTARSASRC